MSQEAIFHLTSSGSGQGGRQLFSGPWVASGAICLIAAVLRVIIGAQAVGTLLVAIALGAGVIALALIVRQLRQVNSGLFVASNDVGVMDSFGRRRGLPISQIDHLQICSVMLRNSRRPVRQLLFIDTRGRSVLRFDGADSLDGGGVEEFARQSGLPLRGSWDETYEFTEWTRRFPGVVSRTTSTAAVLEERPNLGALLGALVTVIFFVILLVVLLSRAHH